MADIMFAGIGGQGVLTAGKVLIQIAAQDGKNVSWTSEYSAEMRGGTALCRVVVSEEEIGSPYPDSLDVLCCMTESAYHAYEKDMRPGGAVVINKSLFGKVDFPDDVSVYGVDASSLAMEAGSPRGANLIMLGAVIKATGMMDAGKFAKTLEEYFEKKGKANPKNVKCFELGYENTEKM